MILAALLCFFFLLLHHHPSFTFAYPYPDFPVDNIPLYYDRCFDHNYNLAIPHDSTFSTPKPRKFQLEFGRRNAIANVAIIVITLLNIVVYKLRQIQEENSGEKSDESSSPLPSEQLCRRFSLAEILSATHNFDESLVIGQGGFGKVYKGVIDSGTVAIKRLNSMSKQGASEFWTEITMLSKFRHSHLVSLIGYCDNYYESILVYEYMVCGTIADHLYKIGGNGDKSPLSWVRRLKICIDAARGLDYLHTGTGIRHRVIHRDVKSTNILLDENWAAKISDFGMSKIGPANQSCTYVSTHVKGTFGYIDPEYFLTRRLTRKSDVYSFGVVLFEVLCGRPPVDLRLPEDQRGLTGWAQHCIKGGTIDQIIDPNLRGQILSNCLSAFVQIANLCLHSRPRKRPTMAEVVAWLEFALSLQERRDSSIITEQFFNGGVYDSQERSDSFTKGEVINADNCEHHEEESDGIIQLGDANGRQSPIKPYRLGVANGGNSLIKPAKKMTFTKVGLFFLHTPRAISEKVRGMGMGKCWQMPKDDLPNTIKPSDQVHGDPKPSGNKKRNNNSGGNNELQKDDGGVVLLHPSLKNATPSPVHRDAKISKIKNKHSDNNNGGNSALPNKDGGAVQQMPPSGQIVTPNLRMFTLAELEIATNNFRRDVFLEDRGYRNIFRGWVNEKTYAPSKVGVGMAVAVKKYMPEGFQGYKEWRLEVEFLARFSHPNLVKLLGYCWEDKEVLTVYEFMKHGSLDTHLFRKGAEPLTWVTRLKIALGAARGLVFLHASAERQIIYRDFKASNILLDGDFNAKLSDFGLAKSGPVGDSTHVSTRVAGTFGYVAPEYVATGHVTVKSDIYGFGVMLLEMLTGLRVLDVNRPSGQHNLVDWARPFLHNRRKLKRVVDSRLEHNYPPKSAFELAALTLKCLEYEPKKRPLMKEVLETLEQINTIHRDETEITPVQEHQE